MADAKSLGTVLATGEEFKVGEHSYRVLPLKLKWAEEFLNDNLSVTATMFNFSDKKEVAKVGKWLERQVVCSDGKPLTLALAFEEDWDVAHLRDFFKRLMALSD